MRPVHIEPKQAGPTGRRLERFSDTKRKSIHDPKCIDEIVDVINAFLNAKLKVGGAGEPGRCIIGANQVTFILPQSGGSGVVEPNDPYLWQSMTADYIVCRKTRDGINTFGDDIFIAKPGELRFSLLQETIDGELFTYSQYNLIAQTRLATWSGGTERQVITPRFLSSSLIWAERATTLVTELDGQGNQTEKPVVLIDKNKGAREWTKVKPVV